MTVKQLIAGMCFIWTGVAWGALPNDPVSYITKGEPLFMTVRTLEKTLNTKIVVKDLDPDQVVTGRYVAADGKAFMDEFAKRNRFVWAYQDNQVFLAPEGTSLDKRAVGASPSSFSKIVFDPKDPNKNGLMIFQLQNASVDDRKISSGSSGTPKVVAGVANLFANFIGAPVVSQNPSQPNPPKTGQPLPESAKLQTSILGLFSKSAAQEAVEDTTAKGINNQRGVYADTRLNAVLVRDKVANFDSYKQIIMLLDRPADMVQLEAFIVDILKQKSSVLGINLGLGGGIAKDLILNPFNARAFFSQVNAMETNGEAETLSVPSVVSLNNEQALFSARQNFFISVQGSAPGAVSSVNQVTAETQLLVTPMIANDSPDVPYNERRVKLLVNVQDASANGQQTQTSTTTTLPSTVENQITTQAVVRSGDTLVIGGQIVRKKAKTVSGVPVLSGIPLLGRLFSQEDASAQDYIRVYVVRPQILGEDSRSAKEARLQ